MALTEKRARFALILLQQNAIKNGPAAHYQKMTVMMELV